MAEQTIFEMIGSFFQQDGWEFKEIEEQSVLQMKARTQNGEFKCYAQADDEKSQFIFYSVAPVNAPEEKLAEFAEFFTRANYGLVIGNFEMDYDDGEIRYKTSIDVEGDRLSPALIKQLVYHNVRIMGKYLTGIEALISGGVSPTQAVERIEG